MTFHVGQKVVCVDVSANEVGRLPFELVKGRIYTIDGIDDDADINGDIGLFLAEIEISPDERFSDFFKSWRFRPIVERKTHISIFERMLLPQGVDA